MKVTARPGRVRVRLRVAVAGAAVLIEVRKGTKRLARDRTTRLLDADDLTTNFTGRALRGRLSVRVTVTAPGAASSTAP